MHPTILQILILMIKCYFQEQQERFVTEYIKMAKGIDACAGTVCVNSGSYTVAIVGNGLDICYPAEHERLMERIRETGLLLSEYPPGTEPSNYTFPQRNRLIASWSDRLIVIAAGRGSGAMITANCADKYGRKVSFY